VLLLLAPVERANTKLGAKNDAGTAYFFDGKDGRAKVAMFYFFPPFAMQPVDMSGSTVAIGAALDDVVTFATSIVTNNITILILFACLALAMGFYGWLRRKVSFSRR